MQASSEIGNDTGASAARPARHRVIALVGMAFEARIAAGPGTFVICRGGESEVAAALDLAIENGGRGMISFGLAGALAPHLRPGDSIVASSIADAQRIYPTDPVWSHEMLAMLPGAVHAPIAGGDEAIADPEAKRRMNIATGAAAVDMESHLVARLALSRGLRFAALRIVIDPAHRNVPPAALAGMRPGGGTSATAVARELAAHPSQLPAVLCLAVDAYRARNALLRVRRMLGASFGFRERGGT